MKKVIICFLIIGCFNIGCFGQIQILVDKASSSGLKSDSSAITKRLPTLNADACIGRLLKAIVESNKKWYKPSVFFYGLALHNKKKYTYIEIFVDKWKDARDTNYIAGTKVNNAIFLCEGDFNNDFIFRKLMKDSILIHLTAAKKSSIPPFPNEPSLQGTFKSCNGKLFYIEVYTRGKIVGYKMKIRH